mgnify:CR=1 FL=1
MTWIPGRGLPEVADLQTLKRQLVNRCATRNNEMALDEQFFLLTFPTKVPASMTLRRASTGYNIVRELMAHLLAEMPIIRVPRRNDTEVAQRQAEKLVAFYNGAWHRLGGQRVLSRLIWYGAVRGPMALRVLPDMGRPDSPEDPGPQPKLDDDFFLDDDSAARFADEIDTWLRRRAAYEASRERFDNYVSDHMPILIDAIDPKYVYPEPTETPRYAFLSWRRPAADIRRVWGQELLGDTPDTENVHWTEFWSEESYAYWVEYYPGVRQSVGTPYKSSPRTEWLMEPKKHGFGFMPIIIDGAYETPLPEPERQYLSIYYPMRDALTAETEAVSQRATLREKLAWSILMIKTERQNTFRLQTQPGAPNYIYPDEDISFITPQVPLDFVTNDQALISQYIERSGIQSVLLGQVRARSGYLQAQLAALAKVGFVPFELALGRMMQKTNTAMLKIVENVIQGPVHTWGYQGREPVDATLRPDDIRGYYRSTVEFRTIRPVDEGARLANIMRMLQMGVSRLRALEEAGIENPEAELIRREAEEMLRHPDISQARALRALRTWGYDQEIQDLAIGMRARQEAQAAQQQAGAGMPMPANPATAPPSPPEADSAGDVDLSLRQMMQGGAQPRRLPPGGMAR